MGCKFATIYSCVVTSAAENCSRNSGENTRWLVDGGL